MNEYYDHQGFPQTNTRASSSLMRAELDAVEQGFDKLPVLAGNGGEIVTVKADATGLESKTQVELHLVRDDGDVYTGAHDFTGATITAPTQSTADSSTKVATTAFVNNVAMNPALPNQTGNAGKFVTTDGTNASWGSVVGFPYLHVRDEKSSGTGGGSSISGTQVRDLNTVKVNGISGASLAANAITLPAGTYELFAYAPMGNCGTGQLSIYNNTDASTLIVGQSAKCNATDTGSVFCSAIGKFTLAAPKDITVRHYTSAVYSSAGLGFAASSGLGEVYTEVQIKKVG